MSAPRTSRRTFLGSSAPSRLPGAHGRLAVLWGENEYVIDIGASYIFLAHAARELLGQ